MGQDPKIKEAPECIHDDMETYYQYGSPNSDTFAPGMEDLQAPPVDEATPWRKRGGWIADLAKQDAPSPELVSEATPDAPAESPVPPEEEHLPSNLESEHCVKESCARRLFDALGVPKANEDFVEGSPRIAALCERDGP